MKIMQTDDISEIFNLPLSDQTWSELLALQNDIQQINFDENSADTWTFIWGNS